MIGFHGGMDNPALLQLLRKANKHNMTLRRGQGADSDTLGTNSVWVMDTEDFPFHQAELCLQFHNNQTGTYPDAYHSLRSVLENNHRLKPTGCPRNYIC